MQEPTASRIFLTAATLGILGDALLHTAPWGINAAIWTTLFFIGAIPLLQRVRPQPKAALAIPLTGAMVAAIGLAWRDSSVLAAVDVILLLGFIGLLSLGPKGVRAWATGIAHSCAALLYTFAESVPGVFRFLLFDMSWRQFPLGRWSRRSLAVLRGLLIVTPALLILGALLMSADAEFSALIRDLIAIDIPKTIGHILLAATITGMCGGFLRSLIRGGTLPAFSKPAFLSIGAIEMNTATAAIDLLFAAFVAVQFRYLFGGAALIKLDSKLTYADYARGGFFELVTVVAIIVPLLLWSEWLIDKINVRALSAFRALAALQIVLVFVIIVSAIKRMQLYTDQYGLTVLRLYTTAFMIWLGVLLLWFAITVLRGNRQRFLIGALASGLVLVIALHALNPDDLIANTNLARAASGRRGLDTSYALSLSGDATPALIGGLNALPAERPCIAKRLLDRDAQFDTDPRTWNASRAQAHAIVSARASDLKQWAAMCPKAPRS
jgi:hypothetical protein